MAEQTGLLSIWNDYLKAVHTLQLAYIIYLTVIEWRLPVLFRCNEESRELFEGREKLWTVIKNVIVKIINDQP